MNKKRNKENKFTYYLYDPNATAVGNGPGGTGLSISCAACDNSMNVLYTLLQETRGVN